MQAEKNKAGPIGCYPYRGACIFGSAHIQT